MMTVREILAKAGRVDEIAARVKTSRGRFADPSTVKKWRANGIPGEHVLLIAEMSGVSVLEILQANRALRNPPPRARGNGRRNRGEPRERAA